MKKKFLPHEVVEPAWFREVSPNSTLDIKDLMGLFGISSSLIHKLCDEGKLPKPDINRDYAFSKDAIACKHSFKSQNPKLHWRISTIREFLRREREKS